MTNKDKYRQLCENEETIPVFCQAWWLDATAKDTWDVAIVEKGGSIFAALPYVTRKKAGFEIITQPPLTQFLGPWIRPDNAKYSKRLSNEKELLQNLFSQLPEFTAYKQNWSPSITNWLPLYWLNYHQTTRYTYRLEDLSNIEEIWKNLDAKTRNTVRKAENKENLVIKANPTIDEFLALNKKVFSRQNLRLPYDENLVYSIDMAANERNCRKIFIAIDPSGKHHAAVYLIWDTNSAYYLMAGSDPDLRNSGASSFCLWEAIKFASTVSRSFDFEGSMIEPVERSFRSFGARQTPYFSISKSNSQLFTGLNFLRQNSLLRLKESLKSRVSK